MEIKCNAFTKWKCKLFNFSLTIITKIMLSHESIILNIN